MSEAERSNTILGPKTPAFSGLEMHGAGRLQIADTDICVSVSTGIAAVLALIS